MIRLDTNIVVAHFKGVPGVSQPIANPRLLIDFILTALAMENAWAC